MKGFLKAVYKAAKEFDDDRSVQPPPPQQQTWGSNQPFPPAGPSNPAYQAQFYQPPGNQQVWAHHTPSPPAAPAYSPAALSAPPPLPQRSWRTSPQPDTRNLQVATVDHRSPSPSLSPLSSAQTQALLRPSPSGAAVQTYTLPSAVATPSISPPPVSVGQAPASHHGRATQGAMQVPGLQDDAPMIRKVLSLDGGGVRGLSIIMILQQVMKRLRKLRGVPTLEPWQEFDLICGTSTGGLIAIMLGRLRMSLDECEQAYIKLSQDIFTPVHSKVNVPGRTLRFLNADAVFDAAPLENNIKQILVSRGLPETERLFEEDGTDGCKVFVCAVRKENSSTVTMRSYESEENDRISPVVAIWEAARATSAASTFFPPIRIGGFGQEFADGGLRHNNPVDLAEFESSQIWPQSDRLIISIGTGYGPGPSLDGNLKELLVTIARIATDTEDRNQIFQKNHQAMVAGGRFFRFNVFHGLSEIDLAEYKAVPKIATYTDTYLDNPETASKMRNCVEVLGTSKQRLDWVGGEQLSNELERLAFSEVFCEICRHCWNGISYNSTGFYCPDCRVHICGNCIYVHDSSHTAKVVRIDRMHVQPRMKGIQKKSACQHCTQDRSCRLQCSKCDDYSLCFGCFSEDFKQDAFFEKHREVDPSHRLYALIYPEYWHVDLPSSTSCSCDANGSAVAHCVQCHKICCVNSALYLCRTCYRDTSALCYYCEECHTRDDAHRQAHGFVRIDLCYDPYMPDKTAEAVKSMIRCPECPQKYLDENSIAYHPHQRVQFFINPALIDAFNNKFYRDCMFKRLSYLEVKNLEDALVTPEKSAVNCQRCLSKIPWDLDLQLCLSPGCLAAFCPQCVVNQRVRHRHKLYKCGFKKTGSGVFAKANLFQHSCDLCGGTGPQGLFIGLMCTECFNYDVCYKCLQKFESGQVQAAEGFPHPAQGLLRGNCASKIWIFWRNG